MFIHVVVFEVAPSEVQQYRADSKMWARYATKARGFISYHTMKRFDCRDHYASVYEWKTKRDQDAFMKKNHDWLVGMSKARVHVESYFNLKSIDRLKP